VSTLKFAGPRLTANSILEDKPYSGWLVWNQERRFLFPAEDRSTLRPWTSADAVASVKEAIMTDKYWEKLSTFYAEENHNETLVADNVACVKSIGEIIHLRLNSSVQLLPQFNYSKRTACPKSNP
jgi:proteasome activator subunit 4